MNPFVLVFFAILSVSSAFALLFTRSQASGTAARRRLMVIQQSIKPQTAGAHGAELMDADTRSFSTRLGTFLERYRFAANLNLLLLHAASDLGVGGTVLCSAGLAILFALGCLLYLHLFLLSAAMGIAGAAIPFFLLQRKSARRLKKFNTALPDAIDLMARSLRAGHAMGSAIEFVAEQSPEPLAFEFVQVYQQQRLGLQFREALLKMGSRIASADLQFLITAILVQKETGGDLTEILDRTSHVIRERIRIEGEVRTRTAQGRLTGWILALLPVILLALISFVDPGYSAVLFHDPVGQKMLYTGGALILVGAFLIRKIVDVQV